MSNIRTYRDQERNELRQKGHVSISHDLIVHMTEGGKLI